MGAPDLLTADPDPAPLSRTLLRLRHDLVIIGRAASTPLPDIFAQRLGRCWLASARALAIFCVEAGARALSGVTPPLSRLQTALEGYASEITIVRNEGMTRTPSSREVERLSALPARATPLELLRFCSRVSERAPQQASKS